MGVGRKRVNQTGAITVNLAGFANEDEGDRAIGISLDEVEQGISRDRAVFVLPAAADGERPKQLAILRCRCLFPQAFKRPIFFQWVSHPVDRESVFDWERLSW